MSSTNLKPVLRIALLLLSVVSASACRNAPEEPVLAPDVSVHTLDGRTLALAGLGRPTLVNFWSTSCVICLKDMPSLVRLHERYAPRGVDILAVAIPSDPPNTVLEYARAQKLPFTVALDPQGEAIDGFENVLGTPTSFLLDATGRIVGRHVGAIDVAQITQALDTLLVH